MANGENYGNLSACGFDINSYSLAMLLAISPIRLIQTVVGVNRETGVTKYRGHCISFESDYLAVLDSDIERISKIGRGESIADDMLKIQVPNIHYDKNIGISLQGPKGLLEVIRTNMPGTIAPAEVDKDQVLKICKAFHAINTTIYQKHCELMDNEQEIINKLEKGQESIYDSVVSDERQEIQKLSQKVESDVSKSKSDYEHLGYQQVILVNKKISKGGPGQSKKVLICMAKALGIKQDEEIGDDEGDEMDDMEEEGIELTDDDNIPRGQGSATAGCASSLGDDDDDNDMDVEGKANEDRPTVPVIGLSRHSTPICEYKDTKSILLLAFPYLFQLGEGCNIKVI
jgi:hypothetical protein